MGYFIFVGLIFLALVAGLLASRVVATNGSVIAFGSVAGAIVLFLVVTAFSSLTTINPGHIGIEKSFGKLVGTTGNGWIKHSPWSSVQSLSVQNELRVYDMTQNNSAVTSDSQPVFLTVQVNYQVERAHAVDLYQSTGGDYINRILDPNVYQFTKEVTAEYTATAFAQNREEIRNKIENKLGKKLRPEGIQINNVSLKNVQFTPALQAAIERTVEANQNAKQALAQVQVVKAEADQRVARATGEAEAQVTIARAKAEAQRLQQKTLTPALLTQQAIDKLNPNVQVIVCDSGKTCIPNAVLAVAGQGK